MPRRVVAAAVVATFFATAWLVGIGLVDDAYIFLRYARHIVAGQGAVFNPGEFVEGYTSPLWLGLLVPLFLVDPEPSRFVLVLGVLFGLGSVAVLLAQGRSLGALALASSPAFVFWSGAGLETPIVALLILLVATTAGACRDLSAARAATAGFLVALTVLARPDTLWLAPALAVVLVRRWRDATLSRATVWLVVVPAVLVCGHVAWRLGYYGEWLPNTAYAKVGVPRSVLLASGADYVVHALLGLGALAVVAWRAGRGWHLWAGTALALWWLALVMVVGGDHFPLYRFVMPVLPLLTYCLSLPGTELRRATLGAAIAIVGLNALSFATPQVSLARKEVMLALQWAEVGKWLDRQLQLDQSIALTAVGSVPYHARRETIDMLGLTDRQIAHQGAVYSDGHPGHQRYDTAYVIGRRPSLIVLPSSGRVIRPMYREAGWPFVNDVDLPYLYALADLLRHPEARHLYEYRSTVLPNGTVMEALWLRSSMTAGGALLTVR